MTNILKKAFLLSLISFQISAQKSTGEILHKLEKLNVVGSALYIAAHPDDENQLFLSYMANEKKLRTAYLSLTRGDGGQNLIGTEQNEAVGLLRTQELLKARSVDGAEQYFTRAIDFGYSKTTEEALKFWNKDSVLYDVVYRIRAFQPDIIVTRFPADERAGHGHHSASAYLAALAFDAAANPAIFPDQLVNVSVWQATRLYWNFYNRGFTNTPPEEGDFVRLDLSTYNQLLGLSYPELAAKARSQHRSQGFGAAVRRGERIENFLYTKGEKAEGDLLSDINTGWSRYDGGELVNLALREALNGFDYKEPSSIIPQLIQAKNAMKMLESHPIVEQKRRDLDQLILDCAGAYLEANAEKHIYTPKEKMKGEVEFIHEYKMPVVLKSIKYNGKIENLNKAINTNQLERFPFEIDIKANQSTQPYFLVKEPKGAIYQRDLAFINLPFQNMMEVSATVIIENTELNVNLPIQHKYVEPAQGEIYKHIEIRPAVTINPNEEVLVWNNLDPKKITFTLQSNTNTAAGFFRLEAAKGWEISPKEISVEFSSIGEKKQVELTIVPNANAESSEFKPIFETNQNRYDQAIVEISYDHIPNTSYFPKATVKGIKLDVRTKGKTIGYIMGAGDEVPKALGQLGYEVSFLEENDLNSKLKSFDAIVVGIRAYNVHEWLPQKAEVLKEYMANGGNVIVQYQTTGGFSRYSEGFSPYPLQLGRSRVSEEDAQVRFIDNKHPLLNYPNTISEKDFENWVQERGLYFGEEWDAAFTPIFSMNDENETPKEGSLLVASVGDGNYIYTGISFFRELPAGVEGAYKLLANLISTGK